MNITSILKPIVLVASLSIAGIASATAPTGTIFSFTNFTLTADLSSFSGTPIIQSATGFTFGGYDIGAAGVVNQIDFTIAATPGYILDSMSFLDRGTFTGINSKFSIGDTGTDLDMDINKASKIWSFSGNGTMAIGSIGYALQSKPTYTSKSDGGYFNVVTAPVPEPESYAMMLAGLGLMGAIARRRSKSDEA